MPRRWVVVIPVKHAGVGKSRLDVATVDHERLARSIALDTIDAAARCEEVAQVVVVTSDPVTRAALREFDRVRSVGDDGTGLNGAIAAGIRAVDAGRPRAVLLGDLPALRPDELGRALALSARQPLSFVADAEGTGTVLVTAQAGIDLRPRFGHGSAVAHESAGFVEVGVPVEGGLRRDLDLAAHIPALLRAGLGWRTAALLGPPAASRPAPDDAAPSRVLAAAS